MPIETWKCKRCLNLRCTCTQEPLTGIRRLYRWFMERLSPSDSSLESSQYPPMYPSHPRSTLPPQPKSSPMWDFYPSKRQEPPR